MRPSLTPEQIERLAAILDQRFREVRREIQESLERSAEEHFIDLAGQVRDSAEEAMADLLVDLGASFLDRHIREHRDIELARARIKAASYGVCTDCGDPIGFQRLLAYPTAKRCLPCQEKRERGHPGQGTPSL